jgi:hypothetical protein
LCACRNRPTNRCSADERDELALPHHWVSPFKAVIAARKLTDRKGRERSMSLWVKGRHRGSHKLCPLYPRKQTLDDGVSCTRRNCITRRGGCCNGQPQDTAGRNWLLSGVKGVTSARYFPSVERHLVVGRMRCIQCLKILRSEHQ